MAIDLLAAGLGTATCLRFVELPDVGPNELGGGPFRVARPHSDDGGQRDRAAVVDLLPAVVEHQVVQRVEGLPHGRGPEYVAGGAVARPADQEWRKPSREPCRRVRTRPAEKAVE